MQGWMVRGSALTNGPLENETIKMISNSAGQSLIVIFHFINTFEKSMNLYFAAFILSPFALFSLLSSMLWTESINSLIWKFKKCF